MRLISDLNCMNEQTEDIQVNKAQIDQSAVTNPHYPKPDADFKN